MNFTDLREQLTVALNDIRLRLRLAFTRGTLKIVYPPTDGKIQTVQATGMAAEVGDRIEHAQPYGLSASPLPGAETFLGAILGQRSHLVAMVISDPRSEPIGKEAGETVLWSAHGQRIWLKHDGSIAITAPGDITMEGENVTITARGTVETKAPVIINRAEDLYQYGTNGHGWNVFPDHIDSYTIGQITGTTHDISPPEVPHE